MNNLTVNVNGTPLDGFVDIIVATDGSMIISMAKNDRSLDDIVGLFGDGAKIEVLSGETVTSTYYNKSIDSITLVGDEIRVHLAVNELQDSAVTELTDRADTSDGAIEDLAAMIADLEARVTALEGNGTDSKVSEDAAETSGEA